MSPPSEALADAAREPGSPRSSRSVREQRRNIRGGAIGPRPLALLTPGQVGYGEALAMQEALVVRRRAGEIPDTLVLLEHDAVVTLGRGADPGHVLLDRGRLARRGIALFETGRGGDVTLHSPGQIVGYPILALEGERRDTHLYLRDLEEVMIRAAADFGVAATRLEGLTGIWIGGEKLGAIGVRLNSGWVTSHGFAFNVSNDLGLFDVIVPCGIRGRGVTSLSRLLGRAVDPAEAADALALRFAEVFGAIPIPPGRCESVPAVHPVSERLREGRPGMEESRSAQQGGTSVRMVAEPRVSGSTSAPHPIARVEFER